LDNRYVRPGRQSAHEIGAPDDPDDAAVTDNDRYAADALLDEKCGHLPHWRVGCDRHDVAGMTSRAFIRSSGVIL
jgi:hypothetical protein